MSNQRLFLREGQLEFSLQVVLNLAFDYFGLRLRSYVSESGKEVTLL